MSHRNPYGGVHSDDEDFEAFMAESMSEDFSTRGNLLLSLLSFVDAYTQRLSISLSFSPLALFMKYKLLIFWFDCIFYINRLWY